MSIDKKITLVVSLLAGLLLIGAGYSSRVIGIEEAIERAHSQGALLGRMLKAAAEASIRDHGHLGHLSDLTSRDQAAVAIFYDRDGRAIAPVPVDEVPVVNPRARRIIERARTETNLVRDGSTPAVFVYRAPLTKEKRVVGALELRIAIDRLVPRSIDYLLMTVAGGLLLFFAVLVAIFSRRAIGRPIASLMDGMDEVIRGDLTATLPLERSDEIGLIAYRFNEMTARLRAAQDEIRRQGDTKLQLEQRLRQSEKLATIGQLSAEIAHEVGTPLNVIGGRARVLERKAEQPDGVRKNAKIIADQAARITKIIQQMLDLARARAPQRGDVDLRQIVEDALVFLEYQTSQIRLIRELPRDLPSVYGDADALQQVVLNLLLNAIQAMPGRGTLRIHGAAVRRRKGGLDLAPPQEYVVLEIEDDGAGLATGEIEKIFDPFYSTKDKGQGTGLGLTVVAGIVKDHDGWVEVDPREPRGTIFRVYLPTEADQGEATSAPGVDGAGEAIEPIDTAEEEIARAEETR